ncbi:MAG: histidine--tRNA ligase [Candidatus Thermoplasmatota archaeon]
MSRFQRPRGTRDLLPQEMEKYSFVEEGLRRTADLFGFREVRTPTFEHTELFTARSGQGIVEEMYSFHDKGGREISLRPEITASIVRMYLNEMSHAPKPIKVFYISNCFRYERPQSGRLREFFQFGAEVLGAPLLEADAEIIALSCAALHGLGLSGFVVRIGHIAIARDMLRDAGVPEAEWPRALHALDKRDFNTLRQLLSHHGNENSSERFETLVTTQGGIETLGEVKPLIGHSAGMEYLSALFERLSHMRVSQPTIDLGVVRGLDYYTGMVFEIDAPALGAEKQVCGGGSYALTEVFGGRPVQSTGFAMGIDRIVLGLERQEFPFPRHGVSAYIIPVGPKAVEKALELLSELRSAGVSVDIEMMGRSLSKALEYASATSARTSVIMGERDLASHCATIRDMRTGEQKTLKLEALVDHYRNA